MGRDRLGGEETSKEIAGHVGEGSVRRESRGNDFDEEERERERDARKERKEGERERKREREAGGEREKEAIVNKRG